MKRKIWIYALVVTGLLLMLTNSCSKDDEPAPDYPEIRLKSGTGLNNGAHIYFLALSEKDSFSNLSHDEMFGYRKTQAEWYIDGDVIPFLTEYKEFNKLSGKYYVIVSAAGVVMTTSVTVLSGKQTFVISGSTFGGGIELDVVQP